MLASCQKNKKKNPTEINLVALAFGGWVYSCWPCAVFVDGLQTWRFLAVCLAGGGPSCPVSCWALAAFVLSQTGAVSWTWLISKPAERKTSPSALIRKVRTKPYRKWEYPNTEWNIHRLSADRIVNGRLLLLLQFSSASFFPIVALALLFSSSVLSGIFGLPKTLESSVGFLSPVVTSLTGGAVWKNLCRADCVFWAEDVQDLAGGVGLTGFTTILSGANSAEEGRGAGSVWLAPFNGPAEMAGPILIPGSEEEGLQLFWWALQIKVSGFFPGL